MAGLLSSLQIKRLQIITNMDEHGGPRDAGELTNNQLQQEAGVQERHNLRVRLTLETKSR